MEILVENLVVSAALIGVMVVVEPVVQVVPRTVAEVEIRGSCGLVVVKFVVAAGNKVVEEALRIRLSTEPAEVVLAAVRDVVIGKTVFLLL